MLEIVMETSVVMLLIDLAAKSSVILVLASVAAFLARKQPAAVRHTVWLAAVLMLPASAVLGSLLPEWSVSMPGWSVRMSASRVVASRVVASPVGVSPSVAERVESTIPNDEGTALLPASPADVVMRSETREQDLSLPVQLRIQEYGEERPAAIESPSVADPDADPDADPIVVRGSAMLVADNVVPSDDHNHGRGREHNHGHNRSVESWIVTCWLIGTGSCAIRLLLGAARLWWLSRRTRVVLEGQVFDELNQCRDAIGLRRSVRLLMDSGDCVPMAWGVFRGVILVPDSISEWSVEQRRSVLIHELGHVARRDCLVQWQVEITRAVYWFQPLIHVAAWRLHVERENACDDIVLNCGVSAREYAQHLLAVVSQCRLPRVACALGVAMSARARIERRLRSVLDVSQNRRRAGSAQVVLALLAGLVISVPLAMLHAADEPAPAEEPQQAAAAKSPADAKEAADQPDDQKQPQDAAPAKEGKGSAFAVGAENAAKIQLNVTSPKVVRVVDENEQPIANARVSVGWWTDAENNSVYIGTIKPPTTDELGRVTLHVPKGAVRAQLSAKADEFAAGGTQYSLAGDPVIVLKRGRVVRVKAVDEFNQPLPDAFPIQANSRIYGREFQQSPDGVQTSPVTTLERRWMRVVDASGGPDRPLRFSELIDVTQPATVDDAGVIVAKVGPGTRLEGRLDDSIPRPIKNGNIDLYLIEGEAHRIESTRSAWVWQDYARVNPDGSFVFESLPSGGHVQLFALVDGWQSANPTEAELRDYFEKHDAGDMVFLDRAVERPGIWPQLFPLPENADVVRVTLPCQKTTSLDVRVVDPAGSPIEGATVKLNPNGIFLGGELFIPGTEGSTGAMVRPAGGLAGLAQQNKWVWSSFIAVTTDADGIARVRNLPGVGGESYEVEADGYVMAPHPTSLGDSPGRYALFERAPGETLRRTTTMERDIPREPREILIVDETGKPVPKVNVTVTEIAMLPDAEQWQGWSVQRFGPIARGETDGDGSVMLRVPVRLGDQRVVRIRVKLEGTMDLNGDNLRDASIWNEIALPAQDDGRVIAVAPLGEKPREPRLQRMSVRLVDFASLLKVSKRELLDALVSENSLVLLRQLLARNGFDDAEPIAFKPERNWGGYVGSKDRSPVIQLPSLSDAAADSTVTDSEDDAKQEQAGRVVVLCSIRPKDATWTDKPPGGFAPDAAFVFGSDGTLIRMLGGGYGAQGSSQNTTFIDLGATGDFFLWTSSFEKHGPFEMISRVYRLGHEERTALTIHHYANSTSWTVRNGTSDPVAEFGALGFEFNGQNIDYKLGGVTPDRLPVARKIIWDGRLNRFAGAEAQSFENRPLYRVVTEESADFQKLDVKPGDVTAVGGRRDFSNWHQWTVNVQDKHPVNVRLVLTTADGIEKDLLPRALLSPGQHNLQLQVDPTKQTETESTLRIRVDGGNDDEQVIPIPRMEIDARPSVAGQSVAESQPAPLRLFDKTLADGKSRLKWVLEAAAD
jgi:beta-lactamase regulating signal transducer with metallopeptidase domain